MIISVRRPRRVALLALVVTLTGVGSACDTPEPPTPPPPPPIHPAFTLTATELETFLRTWPLDAASRDRVRTRPQVFLELAGRMLDLEPMQLELVDKQHALPETYSPDDLVRVGGYGITVSRPDHELRRLVMPDLLAMVETARIGRLDLIVSSAYRSFEYQRGVFQRNVERLGEEQARRVAAVPGESQHQLGTTIDFGSIDIGYGDTDQGRWMATNGWRFGFTMSYPRGAESVTGYSFEPWHFRWIGRDAARMEREFFAGSQQHLLEFWHGTREQLAQLRQ